MGVPQFPWLFMPTFRKWKGYVECVLTFYANIQFVEPLRTQSFNFLVIFASLPLGDIPSPLCNFKPTHLAD